MNYVGKIFYYSFTQPQQTRTVSISFKMVCIVSNDSAISQIYVRQDEIK